MIDWEGIEEILKDLFLTSKEEDKMLHHELLDLIRRKPNEMMRHQLKAIINGEIPTEHTIDDFVKGIHTGILLAYASEKGHVREILLEVKNKKK